MPTLRKNTASLLAMLAVFFTLTGPARAQGAAEYAVADSVTGHLLLESNARKKVQVSSLTEIATAMVVLDWLNLAKHDINEVITIPPAAVQVEQNPIGFVPGDSMTIRDLLYAMLMQGDDVAANTLALHVGEALPAASNESPMQRFVAQMNALARHLGMKNTLFVNPTGSEARERKISFSTAADLTLLAANAMNRSQFRFYVSQKERQIEVDHAVAAAPTQYLLQNTNELVGTDLIDGVRTGTSRRIGPCIIISAAKPPESRQEGEKYIINARRLVVVVLGAQDRFAQARQLLRDGWAAFDQWSAAGKPAAPTRG